MFNFLPGWATLSAGVLALVQDPFNDTLLVMYFALALILGALVLLFLRRQIGAFFRKILGGSRRGRRSFRRR